MSRTLILADAASLDDLTVYLARAARIEEGSVRLIAGSGVLAVYVAVFYPVGLLDESPTVLGLRTLALGAPAELDVVVPIRSLQQRLERAAESLASRPEAERDAPVELALPMEVNTVTWAAISPPRGGWRAFDPVPAEPFERVAREGIGEVAAALPDGAGEQIVRRVRGEIWGRGVPEAEHIPAGAAFAALSLGFLGEDEVRVYETGPWTRLTTRRGHVLVRRRSWTLAR